jgi:16S rRNA (adenine1518-N6/adenine1519-N6)-dimethyltransferase
MNLFSKNNIISLFKKYNIKPYKKLGQNFLISEKIAKKIVNSTNIKKNDIILEIGSGLGILTYFLAQKAKKVIAIEKDLKIINISKQLLNNYKNIEFINEDVLKLDILKLFKQSNIKNYKIIANLPYYISVYIIRLFLEIKNPPDEMILMVQKEVAERICNISKKSNILNISVNFYAKSKIIFFVSKDFFWPKPKVDSAILKIYNIENKNLKINSDLFFKILKTGFSNPRKKLINNLSTGLKIKKDFLYTLFKKNKIDLNRRAEDLNLDDWINLVKDIINLI